MERVIPLSRRKGDIVVLAFFWLNLLLITYIVDVEQIVLPDISGDWEYPFWPPAFMGRHHPLVRPQLRSRPHRAPDVWWRMTIWIDSLALRSVLRLRDLRLDQGQELDSESRASSGRPCCMTNVTIILGEEFMGAALRRPRRSWFSRSTRPGFLAAALRDQADVATATRPSPRTRLQ